MTIWYIFSHFGIIYQEKSGNPGPEASFLDPKEEKSADNFISSNSFLLLLETALRMLRFESQLKAGVARWYILKPNIPIWINFGGFCNGRCVYTFGHLVYLAVIWHVLLPFGIFYGHLVYFMVIWYIFSPLWYVAPRKIWLP
jgi:hypothetical protein